MKIDIITIFPDYFKALDISLLQKAKQKGLLDINIYNLRDFTIDKHRTTDDTPYGGGHGMVMTPEPWGKALDKICSNNSLIIFLDPKGDIFNQKISYKLSQEEHIVFCCGRYEGIDERVRLYAKSKWRAISLSIGNYILLGGEAASLVIIESLSRYIAGVVGNSASVAEDSFNPFNNKIYLEYPLYTKPAVWRGLEVPKVLLSGDHKKIGKWKRQNSTYL